MPHDAFADAFAEEFAETLDALEAGLLGLEADPGDVERVNEVFRALHSAKGLAGLVGDHAAQAVLHGAETLFDEVRSGERPLTPEVIAAGLVVRDRLANPDSNLKTPGPVGGLGVFPPKKQAIPEPAPKQAPEPPVPPAPAAPIPPPVGAPADRFRLTIVPQSPDFNVVHDALGVLAELAGLGESHRMLDPGRIPRLSVLEPEALHAAWTVDLAAGENAIRDLLLFIEGDAAVDLVRAGETPSPESPPESLSGAPFGVERSSVETGQARRVGNPPIPSERVAEPAFGPAETASPGAGAFDRLADVVGRLGAAQSNLTRLCGGAADPALPRAAELVETLVGELRTELNGLCKRPVAGLWERLGGVARLRGIETETSGGGTLVDGAALEALAPVLERLLAGPIFPDSGPRRLSLHAREEAGFATLTAKSAAGRALSDEEVETLRAAVASYRGRVMRDAAETGFALTMILPLTPAVIEGLVVGVGAERVLLPLEAIRECVEVVNFAPGREAGLVVVRGEALPTVRLRGWWGAPGAAPSLERVCVVEVDGERFGLAVDEVLGECTSALKSLGAVFRRVKGVSGAALAPDGTMLLVLDPAAPAQAARRSAGRLDSSP